MLMTMENLTFLVLFAQHWTGLALSVISLSFHLVTQLSPTCVPLPEKY